MRWLALLSLILLGCGNDGPQREVVVFVSHDSIFSKPVLDTFERDTGIKVKAVYDSEATKTTGLVSRLMARKTNPEADVFWNNEVGQTLLLQRAGLLERYVPLAAESIPGDYLDPEGHWSGYALRARVILYNTNLVKPEEVPTSIWDLGHRRWKGRVAIARPLFGTTKTHFAALFALDKSKTTRWVEELLANDVKICEGNAAARNDVADGKIAICLTDTDDANGALLKKAPVAMLYPDQDLHQIGTLLIPNSVCLIKGGPHPKEARQLIEFLLSKRVEEMLAKSRSAQMPVRKDVPAHSDRFRLDKVRGMKVTPAQIADQMQAVHAYFEKRLRDR